jgi:hypothetical protein
MPVGTDSSMRISINDGPEVDLKLITDQEDDLQISWSLKKNYSDATDRVFDTFITLQEKFPALLNHLRFHEIKFLFSHKEKLTKGKAVIGSAKKSSEMDEMLHGYNFIITLDYSWWKQPSNREPMLLHQLLHCQKNDEGNAVMCGHDLEEFTAVVRNYGLWRADVTQFKKQMDLFSNEP